jgi:hypothetical protein
MPVVGFLHSASATEYAHLVAAFRKGLESAGYVEDRNVFVQMLVYALALRRVRDTQPTLTRGRA